LETETQKGEQTWNGDTVGKNLGRSGGGTSEKKKKKKPLKSTGQTEIGAFAKGENLTKNHRVTSRGLSAEKKKGTTQKNPGKNMYRRNGLRMQGAQTKSAGAGHSHQTNTKKIRAKNLGQTHIEGEYPKKTRTSTQRSN